MKTDVFTAFLLFWIRYAKGRMLLYLKAICNLFCKIVKTLSFAGFLWYNIERYYTSADSLSTTGRKISTANHAHPPEGKRINALSMDGGHGIMSADIIPAPVRRPTKGRTCSLANRVHAPQGNMSGGHGIMISKKREMLDF